MLGCSRQARGLVLLQQARQENEEGQRNKRGPCRPAKVSDFYSEKNKVSTVTTYI